MPHKRNNTSKKSTGSTKKETIRITISDDMVPSIVIPSSKKTTPSKKTVRGPFQEPALQSPARSASPPPPAPWDTLGISEDEYKALQERMSKRMAEWHRESVDRYLEEEWNSLSYWEWRREALELSRERYNKMRAWSADVVKEVDEIDAQIDECDQRIEEIWAEADRIETEYD